MRFNDPSAGSPRLSDTRAVEQPILELPLVVLPSAPTTSPPSGLIPGFLSEAPLPGRADYILSPAFVVDWTHCHLVCELHPYAN